MARHHRWAPSSGLPPAPARSRSFRTLLAALTLALPGLIVVPPRLAGAGAEGESAGKEAVAASGSELVRCPDCDGKGQRTCPTCGGRRQLFKPCPICGGKGRKPCPTCTAPTVSTPDFEPTPGEISCTYCGGDGSTGGADSPKTCPRCRGSGRLRCPTCRGKGDLRCKKQVFDKICPTCGFKGRVDCATCQGKGVVSRDVLLSRPSASVAEGEGRAEAGSGSGDAGAGRREGRSAPARAAGPEGLPPGAPSDIVAAYRELLDHHRRAARILSPGAGRELDSLRQRVGTWLTEVGAPAAGTGGELRSRLEALARDVRELRARHDDAADTFEGLHRALARCEAVLLREGAPSLPPGLDRLSARQKDWLEDARLMLRLAGRWSESLARESPEELKEAETVARATAKEIEAAVSAWRAARAEDEALAQSGSDSEAGVPTGGGRHASSRAAKGAGRGASGPRPRRSGPLASASPWPKAAHRSGRSPAAGIGSPSPPSPALAEARKPLSGASARAAGARAGPLRSGAPLGAGSGEAENTADGGRPTGLLPLVVGLVAGLLIALAAMALRRRRASSEPGPWAARDPY